jgi:hypothetical protein
MFLQPLDLTTALRPSLLPEEILLFVQDAVGLYEGCEMLLSTIYTEPPSNHVGQPIADQYLHSVNTKFLICKAAMPTSHLIECAMSIIWNLDKIHLP